MLENAIIGVAAGFAAHEWGKNVGMAALIGAGVGLVTGYAVKAVAQAALRPT